MEEKPRKPRRFQFTIRNVLWAALWLAVCVGAVTIMDGAVFGSFPLFVISVVVAILSPILAATALTGRNTAPFAALLAIVIISMLAAGGIMALLWSQSP